MILNRKLCPLWTIVGSLFLNSCQGRDLEGEVGWKKIQNSRCELVYHFSNPSLGPVLGNRTLKLFLNRGRVERVVDLITGKSADPSLGTPGLKEVIKILEKSPADYRKIKEKIIEKLGGTYRIEIKAIHCES